MGRSDRSPGCRRESLGDAPACTGAPARALCRLSDGAGSSAYGCDGRPADRDGRSEEHTSELQSLMRISYAVFCLKKKKDPDDRLMNTTRIVKAHTETTVPQTQQRQKT